VDQAQPPTSCVAQKPAAPLPVATASEQSKGSRRIQGRLCLKLSEGDVVRPVVENAEDSKPREIRHQLSAGAWPVGHWPNTWCPAPCEWIWAGWKQGACPLHKDGPRALLLACAKSLEISQGEGAEQATPHAPPFRRTLSSSERMNSDPAPFQTDLEQLREDEQRPGPLSDGP
jgi:hypothetical protein